MKKIFNIKVSNKKPERQVDSIKNEVKKYIARERRKKLPEGVDFWDFDCKIGESAENAATIHVSTLNNNIDKVAQEEAESFYLEIVAKPGHRTSKTSKK